ncbi:MAG: hypothetical protein ACKO23_08460, partial [Gemmataceae bacterium]
CLKCLEKDPQHRYASAAHLAEDLKRWQVGEPIRARRHNLAEQVILWARREPLHALGSGIILGLLFLLLGGGIWFLINRAETLAQVTLEAERRREAEDRAESRLFLNGVISVNAREARRKPGWTWENIRDIHSLAPLASAPESQTQLRSEAVAALSAADLRLGKKILPGFKAYHLAYHPRGDWLALAQGVSDDDESKPMEVLLADQASGEERRRLKFPANTEWIRKNDRAESSTAMAVSPDGRHLAVGTRSGWIHLWDLQDKENLSQSWQASASAVIEQVAFAPDGGSLYSLDRAGKGLRWKVGVRETLLPIFGLDKVSHLVSHSPPGSLYLQSSDRLARLSRENPEIPQLAEYPLEARRVSPDLPLNSCRAVAPGHQVGVLERFDMLHLFDVSTGRILQPLSQSVGDKGSTTVVFSPDGRWIARNSNQQGLQLWETTNGQLVSRLSIPLGRYALAFHPDGKTIAVNADDGTYLCDVTGTEAYGTLCPLGAYYQLFARTMAFTDGGNSLSVLLEKNTLPGISRLKRDVGNHFELWKLDCGNATHPTRQGILGREGAKFLS